ncbi:MAG: DUF3592 domain-containing protein [Treponema sp.]|nr:DUF3592 domain-containing protein [Treponema sp.]
MKKLRNIAGNVLFSLAYLAFGIMAMGLAVKDIVFHVNAVRDNEAVIGTVRGVTSRIVGSGRNRHRVYTIVFSYEYDGLACTGEFETEKDLPDRLTGLFETRYREGNKMPVLLVQDGSLIAAAEKKKVIAGDITKIVVALVILAGGLAMLFQLVDAVWDKEDGGGQQELPPANPDEERGQAGLPQ